MQPETLTFKQRPVFEDCFPASSKQYKVVEHANGTLEVSTACTAAQLVGRSLLPSLISYPHRRASYPHQLPSAMVALVVASTGSRALRPIYHASLTTPRCVLLLYSTSLPQQQL